MICIILYTFVRGLQICEQFVQIHRIMYTWLYELIYTGFIQFTMEW